MATPMSAARILSALKAEGVSVQEYGPWQKHNRNHMGAWGPVHGIMNHHTVSSADASSVKLCYDGRRDLPGPLCHGVGRTDGKIALVGWGRANHAGLGDGDVLAAVIAERDLPPDNQANTDGNARFYGLEIVNLGDGHDVYPAEQYEAAVKFNAAICRVHDWDERSCIGHVEWQPGKVDPRGPVEGHGAFTMRQFRADVRACLALPAGQWRLKGGTTQQEEDEMQLDDTVKLGPWVAKTFPKQEGLQDNKISVQTALGSGYAYAHIAADNSTAILAQLGAQQATIEKLVDALGDAGGITAEQVKAAAEQGANAALDRLADALTRED